MLTGLALELAKVSLLTGVHPSHDEKRSMKLIKRKVKAEV